MPVIIVKILHHQCYETGSRQSDRLQYSSFLTTAAYYHNQSTCTKIRHRSPPPPCANLRQHERQHNQNVCLAQSTLSSLVTSGLEPTWLRMGRCVCGGDPVPAHPPMPHHPPPPHPWGGGEVEGEGRRGGAGRGCCVEDVPVKEWGVHAVIIFTTTTAIIIIVDY